MKNANTSRLKGNNMICHCRGCQPGEGSGIPTAFKNECGGDPRQKHSGMTNVASGFTLIELLVVVLIIGILAAVALPQYQKAVEKSRVAGVWSVMGSLKKAAEVYVIDGNSWVNPEELDIDIDTLYCSAERCTVTCPSSGWSNCYYLISKDGQRTCGEESWTSVSGIGVSFGFSKDNQEMELLLNDKGQFCIGSLCQLFGFQPLAQTRPSCQRPSRP